MTDSDNRNSEVAKLAAIIDLMAQALESEQQANIVLRMEREQLCGALAQANTQVTQILRCLRELRGQDYEAPTKQAHSIH